MSKKFFLGLRNFNKNTLEKVKGLIESGIDVNSTYYQGNTPLDEVCWVSANEYTLPIVKYLVEKGADVNSNRNGTLTPFHVIFLNPINEYTLDIVKYLVEKGADVNSKHVPNNNTPLHSLFHKLRSFDLIDPFGECISRMINITPGKEINKYDSSIVKLLIDQGADVNARNKDDNTPMDYLLTCSDNEHKAFIIKYLEEKGAIE